MEAADPEYLPLVVAVRGIPLQVQADLRMQDGHSACLAEGIAQPTLDATRTLGSGGAPDSAACRGVVCKASIAVGESR